MHNKLKGFWPKEWPPAENWKRLPEVLTGKEKIIFFSLVFLFLFSSFYLIFQLYFTHTKEIPASGGIYREGVVKSGRWLTINPVYASQSDIERDIIEIAFDGLMVLNENGDLVPNLALGYETKDHRVFDLRLRDDIFWSDGEKITAEDIIFTVEIIQSPDFQSTLRQQWTGVKAEKLSERKVRFTLNNSSSVFPENFTLKPIPKHIFEEMSSRDFRYSVYNMKAVGSGPYRFRQVEENEERIKSITFERNPYYHLFPGYMDEVSFIFHENEEGLLQAKKRNEIDGFVFSDDIEELSGFRKYEYLLPRYFFVLFNLQKEGILQENDVRVALKYATNKQEIVNKVLGGNGIIINSPLLPEFYDLQSPEKKYEYHPEKAKEILLQAGFENGKKTDEDPFQFTKDLKEDSQGEEVRNLQRCLIYLEEDFYPKREVTGFFDEDTKEAVSRFQEFHHQEILAPHGFDKGTGMVAASTRKKLNELCADLFDQSVVLEISITTLDDPMLVSTAEIIKEQWERMGITVNIEKKGLQEFKEKTIRPREYEAILFGTALTGILNPFPLWHSSKIEDPGINLSGYESETADRFTETIIKEKGEERANALLSLQEEILENAPGVFLYNPYFNHFVSKEIKGIKQEKLINSSERFKNINEWYINTKRILK